MSEQFHFFATAPRGVASLLYQELIDLGCEAVKEQPAGVSFGGTLEQAYRACLWSRTASRVLLKLSDFYAPDPDALYKGVSEIDWSAHLDVDNSLAVGFSAVRSKFTHSHFGALKVKDAIVDQLRDGEGRRPSIDTARPDVRVSVHVHRDQATVYIDLAGDGLHKRGYRLEGAAAPLKENLAAAILLRAGWPETAAAGGAFVDPMCGSGTLVIEAALMAADIAPGLARDYYGFLGWKQHDEVLWLSLLEEARQRKAAGLEQMPALICYDKHPKAIAAARENIAAAELDEYVRIAQKDVAQLSCPAACEQGMIVVNPPYGERLGEKEELEQLYATFGERLKAHFSGWQVALITGNPDLAKHMGIRAWKMHPFYNGALECKLLRFKIDEQWYMNPRRLPRAATEEELTEAAQMLANRLRKNIKQLGRWARREQVSCYRVYDADLPEYALAIDRYQAADGEEVWLHIQEYEAPKSVDPAKAKARLREALAVIPEVFELPEEQLFFKVRKRQKGKAQYEKVAGEQDYHKVEENGCGFWVNFSDYLDTGLFLDHRSTRNMLKELAAGEHFLNLFAYTGSGSVYAAAGGAESTTTVDMSNTYLNWARRNMSLNGFEGRNHEFIQADCMAWLAEEAQRGRRKYGLIFLDPPTFSTSKRMQDSFDVQRDHVQLINHAAALLKPGGILIFSNNFRRFKLDREQLAGLDIEEITKRTIPQDFARNSKIHRCWRIRRAAA